MNEAQIQKAVFDHLRQRAAPDVFFTHVPNGGKRDPITGAQLKRQGVVAGVPDVLLLAGGSNYWLELKAAKGRLTPIQMATHQAMKKAGAAVAVTYGLDEALEQLWEWGLIA